MLSLSLSTPPQAQLEALRGLRAHVSGSSWLHASLALQDLFDSALFDSSGRLVCSHGPCQLSCCRGVGASLAAFSSAWASVDSACLNQTSEPIRLPPIGFRSCPSWLSPTRLRSSRPRWLHLPHEWLASALSFGSLLRLLPFCPPSAFFAGPPSASSADPKSNSSLPLLSCSLAWSFGTLLPLKFGTSR